MLDSANYNNIFKHERFDECYKIACDEYLKTHSEDSLKKKASLAMILKRYDEASEYYKKIIQIDKSESDSYYISAGVAHWLLGKHEEAIEIWQDGEKALYTDAGGGVIIPALLYYASISLNNELLEARANKSLLEVWKTSRAQANFPGPIAGYLLNQIDDKTLISTLSHQPSLRLRQMCKAHFYIALKNKKNGKTKEFYNHLHKALSNKTYIEKEYYLAIGEMDKISENSK